MQSKTKNEHRKATSVLSFFVLCANKQKTGKLKIDFRFFHFSFYARTKRKTEKRKSTSVFSFFVLCANKEKKTEKRKSTSVLSFFVLCMNKQKSGKNENRLPSYHFPFYAQTKENQGIGTGADTNHIVGGGFIGGGEGGVVHAGQEDRGSWRRKCCSRSACALFCEWFWLVDSFGAVYYRVISFSEILSRNSQDYWVGTVSFKTLRILNCEACVILLFSQSWTTVLSDDLTAECISAVFGVSEAFLYSWLNTGSSIFCMEKLLGVFWCIPTTG